MNLQVEYKGANGLISNRNYYMPYLALLKHMACVGMGKYKNRHPFVIKRSLGMLLHYWEFLNFQSFCNNQFYKPPRTSNHYDPTEIAQFSCIVGRGIADFLAKRIDRSTYTDGYEAYLAQNNINTKNGDKRADLVAYRENKGPFVIECKGISNVSPHVTLNNAKNQINNVISNPQLQGRFNFGIACVSYNLYNQVKVCYHDPKFDNIKSDDDFGLKELSKLYYKAFFDLYKEVKKAKIRNFGKEKFIIVNLGFENSVLFRCIGDISLILPYNIKELSENGISRETQPFEIENNDDGIYIDNDRIGLMYNNL